MTQESWGGCGTLYRLSLLVPQIEIRKPGAEETWEELLSLDAHN